MPQLDINNPVNELLEEAELVCKDEHGDCYIKCIVSIGAGQTMPGKASKHPSLFHRWVPTDLIKVIFKVATDCGTMAEQLERRFGQNPGVYARFNVASGMQNTKLKQWKKLDEVRTHTTQYIGKSQVQHDVEAVAKVLVGKSTTPGVVTSHLFRPSPSIHRQSASSQRALRYPRPPNRVFAGSGAILEKLAEPFFPNDSTDAPHRLNRIFIVYRSVRVLTKYTAERLDCFSVV